MLSISPNKSTVVLLAAGRGSRMRALTDNTPKPLLKVGKLSLIEHHLVRLAKLGFEHVVINIAYLGEQIPQKLGDGSQYNVHIDYSDERDSDALETAGGLKKALPLIQSDPFIVINTDIWTDFDFSHLLTQTFDSGIMGYLVMVNNPAHNKEGDFSINPNSGLLSASDQHLKLTFSGIATYQKKIFESLPAGKQALAPVFKALIEQQCLAGINHDGLWSDIGTPERLSEIDKLISAQL